jgi:hypothetical protein
LSEPPPEQPPAAGKIVVFPEAGELHHRCGRFAAWDTGTIDPAIASARSVTFHSLRWVAPTSGFPLKIVAFDDDNHGCRKQTNF